MCIRDRGMDCPLIRELCAAGSVPVIVSGGCGGPGDAAAAAQAGAAAVAVASILHYKKTTGPQLKAGIREHGIEAVSYTHLDVYKRQGHWGRPNDAPAGSGAR